MATTTQVKRTFANDGSYESVRLQLHRLAMKCLGRLQAQGVTTFTFDDVLQEMNLTYVKARSKWNPDAGVRFITYLTTACYNNFNDRVKKPVDERANLGMVNFSDMRRTNADGDDDCDLLEFHDRMESAAWLAPSEDNMNMDSYLHRLDGAGGMCEPAEADIERRQQAQAALRLNMAKLTPKAQEVVIALMRASYDGDKVPSLFQVARLGGISRDELTRIKQELATTLGVTL